MFVLIRTVVYASTFIALFLVFVPARLLERSGIVTPPAVGPAQVAGAAVAAVGGFVALWSVFTFAFLGRGTPAPFDPPRRLVVGGPYRYVRNPMYLGAVTALAGAALFYRSLPLLGYCTIFIIVVAGFVVAYEEPVLRRTFGPEYERYCRAVGRWWPARPHRDRTADP